MVKGQTIKKLIINLIVVAGFIISSCCLTSPVRAAETIIAPLKITEIYPNALNANVPGGAETGFEFVEIVNLSSTAVDLSQYGLRSKGKTKSLNLTGVLAPYSYLAIASTSSFALVNDGETIQLVELPSLNILEEVTYGKTTTKDKSWSFFTEGWELGPITKGALNVRTSLGDDSGDQGADVCPLTPAIDSTLPPGYIIDVTGQCVVAPAAQCLIEISEISSQPNYNSQEYIELVNTSTGAADLSRCKLKINEAAEKSLLSYILQPGQRYVASFPSGSIRNSAGTVVLVRSDNQEWLYSYAATSARQVVNYAEGGLVGVVSNLPTPGFANETDPEAEDGGLGEGVSTILADCGAGKYRNPETNRCKALESVAAELASCAADQERNPATNRCRKITSATASLVPCAAGQERNPETNRCRKIGSIESELKPCAEGQERNPETNRCRKASATVGGESLEQSVVAPRFNPLMYKPQIVGVLLIGLAGYGLYEYRQEIRSYYEKVRVLVARGRPPD